MLNNKDIVSYYITLGIVEDVEEEHLVGIWDLINRLVKEDNKSGEIMILWELYLNMYKNFKGITRNTIDMAVNGGKLQRKMYYKGFIPETSSTSKAHNRMVMDRVWSNVALIENSPENWEEFILTNERYKRLTGHVMFLEKIDTGYSKNEIEKLGVKETRIEGNKGYILDDIIKEVYPILIPTREIVNGLEIVRTKPYNNVRELVYQIREGIVRQEE